MLKYTLAFLIIMSGCTPRPYTKCETMLGKRGFWIHCPIDNKMHCQYCSEAETKETKLVCGDKE